MAQSTPEPAGGTGCCVENKAPRWKASPSVQNVALLSACCGPSARCLLGGGRGRASENLSFSVIKTVISPPCLHPQAVTPVSHHAVNGLCCAYPSSRVSNPQLVAERSSSHSNSQGIQFCHRLKSHLPERQAAAQLMQHSFIVASATEKLIIICSESPGLSMP